MKLQINKSSLKSVITDIFGATKEWTQVRVVNYKNILDRYGLPTTGVISSTLVKFLLKKEFLLERRRGRAGVTWKWNEKFPDIDSITGRYIAHLNSLEYNKKGTIIESEQSIIKPREFNLRDVVFLLYDNQIHKVNIIGKELVNDIIKYKVDLIIEVDNEITYVTQLFDYEVLHISVDDLLDYLRFKYYGRKK